MNNYKNLYLREKGSIKVLTNTTKNTHMHAHKIFTVHENKKVK